MLKLLILHCFILIYYNEVRCFIPVPICPPLHPSKDSSRSSRWGRGSRGTLSAKACWSSQLLTILTPWYTVSVIAKSSVVIAWRIASPKDKSDQSGELQQEIMAKFDLFLWTFQWWIQRSHQQDLSTMAHSVTSFQHDFYTLHSIIWDYFLFKNEFGLLFNHVNQFKYGMQIQYVMKWCQEVGVSD